MVLKNEILVDRQPGCHLIILALYEVNNLCFKKKKISNRHSCCFHYLPTIVQIVNCLPVTFCSLNFSALYIYIYLNSENRPSIGILEIKIKPLSNKCVRLSFCNRDLLGPRHNMNPAASLVCSWPNLLVAKTVTNIKSSKCSTFCPAWVSVYYCV